MRKEEKEKRKGKKQITTDRIRTNTLAMLVANPKQLNRPMDSS